MAQDKPVISALSLIDLNSMVYVTSDRQLSRDEVMKAFGIYVALNPEQRNRRDTEYHIKLPSRVIPNGLDFSQDAFDSLEAEAPRPMRQQASSEKGCVGSLILLSLMGLAACGFIAIVLD